VSITLMVEVLDHYHGPHSRKLWLIAWAEKVTEGSRAGYCRRTILAARLGVSPGRASQIAREIQDEGAIKRLGGGVGAKPVTYELLPLDTAQGKPRANPPQGKPRANPQDAVEGKPRANAQGKPRANAEGKPRANPNLDSPEEPSSLSPAERDLADGLGWLGATERETEFVITAIRADPGVRNRTAYIRKILDSGDPADLLDRARRDLADADADGGGGGDPPPPKPEWCGQCDEQTRLMDMYGDHPHHCPNCHPLSGQP
jgi:hypothetical protein